MYCGATGIYHYLQFCKCSSLYSSAFFLLEFFAQLPVLLLQLAGQLALRLGIRRSVLRPHREGHARRVVEAREAADLVIAVVEPKE